MARILSTILTALMLASLASSPVSADGYGTYRKSASKKVPHRVQCHCVPLEIRVFRTLASNYDAFYYNSRGGVGRAYSTTAYSTDGYPRTYRD